MSKNSVEELVSDRDPETLFALDNVPLELPIAGAPSRALAAFLDYLILSFLALIWLVGSTLGFSRLALGAGWLTAIVIGGLFVLNWGYFAGWELALGGRTPGKLALGLRVVSRTGGKAGAAAILVRNLLRAVDLLVGVPMMASDPLARRLGDRLAATLVLRQSAGPSESAIERIPSGWGAREVAFVEALLDRLDELAPERARELSLRTLELVHKSDPLFLPRVDEEDPAGALRRAFLSV